MDPVLLIIALGAAIVAFFAARILSSPKADVRAQRAPSRPTAGDAPLPKLVRDEDDDDELTRLADLDDEPDFETDDVIPIVHDDDADADEPTQTRPMILVVATGRTDQGRNRKRNEDSYLVLDDSCFYAVADGMGGYAGGDVASQLAVDAMKRSLEQSGTIKRRDSNLPTRATEVAEAIQEANRTIFEHARKEPHLKGMGTTVSGARFAPKKQRLYIGHVGDSRTYRIRAGEIQQMTTDHTMGALGAIGKNAETLTRVVGTRKAVSVDLIMAKPEPGDLYLICSDGLTRMLDNDTITATLNANADDLQHSANELVRLANEAGGVDNITAIVVKVLPPAKDEPTKKGRNGGRQRQFAGSGGSRTAAA